MTAYLQLAALVLAVAIVPTAPSSASIQENGLDIHPGTCNGVPKKSFRPRTLEECKEELTREGSSGIAAVQYLKARELCWLFGDVMGILNGKAAKYTCIRRVADLDSQNAAAEQKKEKKKPKEMLDGGLLNVATGRCANGTVVKLLQGMTVEECHTALRQWAFEEPSVDAAQSCVESSMECRILQGVGGVIHDASRWRYRCITIPSRAGGKTVLDDDQGSMQDADVDENTKDHQNDKNSQDDTKEFEIETAESGPHQEDTVPASQGNGNVEAPLASFQSGKETHTTNPMAIEKPASASMEETREERSEPSFNTLLVVFVVCIGVGAWGFAIVRWISRTRGK